jgi:hypothetical protein
MNISPKEGNKSISLSVLPDTGAQIDAIPADLYHSEFSPIKLMPGETNTITAIGSRIVNLGHFTATICWPHGNSNTKATSIIHVLQDLKQPVISQAIQKNLGMLPAGYPNQRVEIFNINAHQEAFSNLLANIYTHPTEGIKQNDLKNLTNDFPLIFDGVCRPMAGPACHFELKKDAVPVAFRGSRPVAEPLMPLLKKELDLLEQQDVVRKVSKPTAWVHPIVIAPKSDGGIRVCGDFTILNKSIIRPHFETATPFQAVRTIPPGMHFLTVTDALKGYHQVSCSGVLCYAELKCLTIEIHYPTIELK